MSDELYQSLFGELKEFDIWCYGEEELESQRSGEDEQVAM